MKKQLAFIVLCAIAVWTPSCGAKKNDPGQEKNKSTSDTTTQQVKGDVPITPDVLIGYYVGDFNSTKYDVSKNPSYTNKINISVDSVKGDVIYGHSVIAGNLVAYIGNIKIDKRVARVTEAKEQGKNKYNGVFNFDIMPDKKRLTGKWTANDQKLAVTECEYDLTKKVFTYNPENSIESLAGSMPLDPNEKNHPDEAEVLTGDIVKFNASTTLLKEKDIANMYKGDLEVLRNSIYARHGYSFRNRRMRFLFDELDWYVPVSVDVRKELSEIEMKNHELIKRYEDYADKYYDSFGR